MEERAWTNADLGSGGTISVQQRPDLGPGARPRRSGTGTTQPLGATRGRLAWAGAALAPPTRSRSGGRGPGVPNSSRAWGQPGSDGSVRSGLGHPRLRPLEPLAGAGLGWPRPEARGGWPWRVRGSGWAASTRGPARGAGWARGGRVGGARAEPRPEAAVSGAGLRGSSGRRRARLPGESARARRG